MTALDFRLDGRHALVCGASRGIGRAIALGLAAQGAEVTVLARRAELLEALTAELEQAGAPQARALAADQEDRPALRRAVQGLLERHGPVHVLVNNSGGPPAGRLLDAGEDELLRALGRHLLVDHLLAQTLVPGMQAAGFGRIVNVVSTSVYEPIAGLGVSNTVRAAVGGWAKTLSDELPPGITINNVLPGFTDTERLRTLAEAMGQATGRGAEAQRAAWIASVPEGRLGTPEEVAAAAVFLASPAAAYIRGQSLTVDGGRMRSI